MAAPSLEAARYRACASRGLAFASAHSLGINCFPDIGADRGQNSPCAFQPGLRLLEHRDALRQTVYDAQPAFDTSKRCADVEDFVFDVHCQLLGKCRKARSLTRRAGLPAGAPASPKGRGYIAIRATGSLQSPEPVVPTACTRNR